MDGNCNGSGSSGSLGDEGYSLRSPLNTNGVSSRKKFKHRRQVSEECYTVDPAFVPRKLRSAINEHTSRSESPPMPDSKRRQLHPPSETQNFNGYSAKKTRQQMRDVVTKEEEEVAGILTSMATLISASNPINLKENGRMLEENPETKATSTSLAGDLKEEGAKILLPCSGSAPTNLAHVVELDEMINVDPKFNGKLTSEPNSLQILSSEMDSEDYSTPSRHAINLSNPLGGSIQCLSMNGLLQPQSDAILTQKQDMGLALWPFGSSTREQHDLLSVRQKPERNTHGISWKETDSDVQPGLPIGVNQQFIMPSSGKNVACLNPSSTNGEMLHLASADKKRAWNRSTTHVYLAHLIKNHQKPQKDDQQIVLPSNHSKATEGTNSKASLSSGTGRSQNGIIPPLSNGFLFDRNILDGRTPNVQDGRLQAQAQQAKQGLGVLTFSGLADTKVSSDGSKASGQIHVSYPLPHDSFMSFGFPRGPYPSNYQEQFATAVNHAISRYNYSTHLTQASVDPCMGLIWVILKVLLQQNNSNN